MAEDITKILEKFWGFSSFRPNQIPIIQDVIQGNDVLALLPTGGGKSICFQVPGLYKGGLTLVISPLISLMEDQVKNLKNKGIKACAITSSSRYREIDVLLNNAALGAYEFLYLSPERIQTSLFRERIKQMPVRLLVIDEAHCISEWGHDFRPSYRNIKSIREIRPELPVVALTATATPEVKEDIIEQLELKHPKVHESSFYRENLSYELIQTPNKLASIVSYCSGKESMSGIVYCGTRKAVKDLAMVLTSNKISASIYHGGMTAEQRSASLERWMKGSSAVMVATNAFGMGIDKPDVRYVLHYDFPNTLEAFVQEAGRAGRDLKASRSIAFLEGNETMELQKSLELKFPPMEDIKTCFFALQNLHRIAMGSGKDETYSLDFKKLCEITGCSQVTIYHCLKILELNGNLIFDEATYHPAKFQLLLDGIALYNFQIKNPHTHPLLHLFSKMAEGRENQFIEWNPKKIQQQLKVSLSSFDSLLTYVVSNGVIDYQEERHLPAITFLQERRPDDYFELSFESYQKRKDNTQRKLHAVFSYLNHEGCRARFILSYFGQNGEPCGQCDNCKREGMNMNEMEAFILSALQIPLSFIELLERIPVPKDDLTFILRSLQLTQKIQLIDGKFYV
ncbi:MAG: ATP-dependent DNA helicase RecQ [Flavobacteriales bacterium]